MELEDHMPSYFLAEACKYLYLLFDDSFVKVSHPFMQMMFVNCPYEGSQLLCPLLTSLHQGGSKIMDELLPAQLSLQSPCKSYNNDQDVSALAKLRLRLKLRLKLRLELKLKLNSACLNIYDYHVQGKHNAAQLLV